MTAAGSQRDIEGKRVAKGSESGGKRRMEGEIEGKGREG